MEDPSHKFRKLRPNLESPQPRGHGVYQVIGLKLRARSLHDKGCMSTGFPKIYARCKVEWPVTCGRIKKEVPRSTSYLMVVLKTIASSAAKPDVHLIELEGVFL